MTEIGDASAGNESHISRADHCHAHRFCSSDGSPPLGSRLHADGRTDITSVAADYEQCYVLWSMLHGSDPEPA
jgi:hypothetical protein